MGPDVVHLSLLALAWVAYGALHSLLAAEGLKARVAARFPGAVPTYRLGYNLMALVALLPVVGLMAGHPGPWLWRWTGPLGWLLDGLALGAVGLLVVGPATYDLGEFLGLRALREGRAEAVDLETFRISDLHRFVRHPWYALSLVVLWTRDMNAARLVSALAVTAYIVIGSHLEEQKLVARFGEAYRRYRERVPSLVPRPWRTLSRDEARRLQDSKDLH